LHRNVEISRQFGAIGSAFSSIVPEFLGEAKSHANWPWRSFAWQLSRQHGAASIHIKADVVTLGILQENGQ
jgi:hypothetical protein